MIEHFNNLLLHEKADILGKSGKRVDRRIVHAKYIVDLYLAGELFVEVYTSSNTYEVHQITAIPQQSVLEQYAHMEWVNGENVCK